MRQDRSSRTPRRRAPRTWRRSSAERILAVTFTHRAKDNIRERLGRYVPLAVQRDRVTVTNFHGLAARLVRAHGAVADIDPNITICETDWVREQCHAMNLGWDDIKAVERALRVAKQGPNTDEEVADALAEWGNRLAATSSPPRWRKPRHLRRHA